MPDPDRPRRATALRYEPGVSQAPVVVARGSGHIAARILEAAREAGVPVREDPALAAALTQLELDEQVPEELYVAVAEALVWAYRLTRRASTMG